MAGIKVTALSLHNSVAVTSTHHLMLFVSSQEMNGT